MPSSDQLVTWEQAVAWLRAQPEHLQLVRDSYQDDPLLDAANRYWKSDEWTSIAALLGPGHGRNAVDIGAGRGIASYALAREGYSVSSLEPDDSDLVGGGAIRALAAETSLPIVVVQGHAESLPLPADSADLVFARAALHHTRNLGQACREFFRVLKPGGRMLAIREHVISKPSDLPAFLEAHPLHRLYGGENAFPLNEYIEAFRSAGFEITRVIGPLASAINYAPQTRETLREGFAQRLSRIPGGETLGRYLLRSRAVFWAALRAAALVDNRPGRLYSFLCKKPAVSG